jgi:hypothetical protein
LSNVEFKDFTIEVKGAINSLASRVLEEVAGEVESQVKRNTVVDTGKTKNSWTHRVSQSGDGYTATVGSPEENAIWEEFGTGDYALNGNGRKGGWFYVDERGKGHFTHGKHPRRPLYKTYTAMKNKIIRHIQDAFKGGLS